jgi:hypothetical protein
MGCSSQKYCYFEPPRASHDNDLAAKRLSTIWTMVEVFLPDSLPELTVNTGLVLYKMSRQCMKQKIFNCYIYMALICTSEFILLVIFQLVQVPTLQCEIMKPSLTNVWSSKYPCTQHVKKI